MNIKLTKRDWAFLLSAVLVLQGLLIIGWLAIGVLSIGIILVLAVSLVLFFQAQHRRERLRVDLASDEGRRQYFEQTEALLGLYFPLISSAQPLPKTRRFAGSPDFLRIVFELIRKEEPWLPDTF